VAVQAVPDQLRRVAYATSSEGAPLWAPLAFYNPFVRNSILWYFFIHNANEEGVGMPLTSVSFEIGGRNFRALQLVLPSEDHHVIGGISGFKFWLRATLCWLLRGLRPATAEDLIALLWRREEEFPEEIRGRAVLACGTPEILYLAGRLEEFYFSRIWIRQAGVFATSYFGHIGWYQEFTSKDLALFVE